MPAVLETQVLSLGREDPLEKEMATHSSVLARRIPWTEEPGGRATVHGGTHDCFPSRKETYGEPWLVCIMGNLWLMEGRCPPAVRPPGVTAIWQGRPRGGSRGRARPVPGGGSVLAVPVGSWEPRASASRGGHSCSSSPVLDLEGGCDGRVFSKRIPLPFFHAHESCGY